MSVELLQTYTSLHTEKIFQIRTIYYQNLKNGILENTPEDSLPFASKDMYECWINYSPIFFRDFKGIYMRLLQKGYQPEDLTSFIENKARVTRYFAQILLPGAFLDQETPANEKIDFLEKFVLTARKVMRQRYEEPAHKILYNSEPFDDNKRIAVARLIGIMDEACELIYFGDQTVGFTDFGLDRKTAFPEHYTLFQDCDINLGVQTFPEIEKIKTYAVYPQHEHTAQPYIMILDKASAQLFSHGFWDEYKWRVGRPHNSLLINGGAVVGNKKLSVEEIEHRNKQLLAIINFVNNYRTTMSKRELNVEYCITQSNAIRKLYEIDGKTWKISREAEMILMSNEVVNRLKIDWNLNYSFEVAYQLIRRSIEWVKNLPFEELD